MSHTNARLGGEVLMCCHLWPLIASACQTVRPPRWDKENTNPSRQPMIDAGPEIRHQKPARFTRKKSEPHVRKSPRLDPFVSAMKLQPHTLQRTGIPNAADTRSCICRIPRVDAGIE